MTKQERMREVAMQKKYHKRLKKWLRDIDAGIEKPGNCCPFKDLINDFYYHIEDCQTCKETCLHIFRGLDVHPCWKYTEKTILSTVRQIVRMGEGERWK